MAPPLILSQRWARHVMSDPLAKSLGFRVLILLHDGVSGSLALIVDGALSGSPAEPAHFKARQGSQRHRRRVHSECESDIRR